MDGQLVMLGFDVSIFTPASPELWKEVEQNPVLFLERINYEKLVALAHDENFQPLKIMVPFQLTGCLLYTSYS